LIGVVVIAHAPLAAAMLACAHHVYGEDIPAVRAIDVVADSDVEAQVERVLQAATGLDSGSGVLILVDLFGATPGNIAARVAKPGRIEVVAGLNLSMLLKVLCYRDSLPLSVMTEKAVAGGVSGIMKIASTPPQDQQRFTSDPRDGGSSAHGDARLQDQQ